MGSSASPVERNVDVVVLSGDASRDQALWAFLIITIIVLIIAFAVCQAGSCWKEDGHLNRPNWDNRWLSVVILIVATLLMAYGSYRAFRETCDVNGRGIVSGLFALVLVLLFIWMLMVSQSRNHQNAFYLAVVLAIVSLIQTVILWKASCVAGYASTVFFIVTLIAAWWSYDLMCKNPCARPCARDC